MGLFLACTAFRSDSVAQVGQAVAGYFQLHGVSHQFLSAPAAASDATDAQVFAPVNGWVVILWPAYFNVHDAPLARAVAADTGLLLSSVHIYDDTYWEHLAVQGAHELHAFCSRPNFWQPAAASQAGRSSDIEPLAAKLNVPRTLLDRYLVDVDQLANDTGKADPADQFTLGDCWVFTDFWRRLGIQYPQIPATEPATLIRLSRWFAKKLPAVN